jgi:hypothetical protein
MWETESKNSVGGRPSKVDLKYVFFGMYLMLYYEEVKFDMY